MDYQKKYEDLKDKVIDNFNYWLDDHITTDISEVGEVDYMITDFDEYLFCTGLEQELKFIIDDLISDGNNRDLLINFVGLKRILNKRMLQNPHYNEEDIDEIYGIEKGNKENIQTYIKINSSFHNSDEILGKLHSELKSNEYIDCTLSVFKSIFQESKESTKVIWNGTILQLIGLIKLLQRKGFISRHSLTRPKIAFNFFKSKKGEYKLRSIQTTSSRVEKEELSYEEIEELVEEIFN